MHLKFLNGVDLFLITLRIPYGPNIYQGSEIYMLLCKLFKERKLCYLILQSFVQFGIAKGRD